MFHYRLAPSNNRSRMFIAVLLAIALHMGLVNFKFKPKPLSVPSVSLPRSVSIFLQQSSIMETSEQSVKKTHDVGPVNEEQLQAEIEPEAPVLQEIPAAIHQAERSFQPPLLLEKKVKKADVEKIVPAYHLKSETGEAAKVQKPATKAEPQAVQEEGGVILAGTIQMAYPRYQLNEPPAYPGLARKREQEGTVILQVLVNREGKVGELKVDVSSDFTLLDRAALTAVQKWSFEPGRRGEERVPMWVRVPVTFKLKK